jgi:hypothetical protein
MPSLASSSLAIRSSPQSGFLYGHTSNQPAEFQRNGWTARPGLVAPQQSPSGAVPTDHRLRANDHQARAPIAQSGQKGQARPRRGIDALGFMPRSLKSASWRRSTRFSASSDRRGRTERTAKPTASASNRRTIQAWAITPHHATDSRGPVNPNPQTQSRVPDPVIADHNCRSHSSRQLLSLRPLLDR